MLSEAFREAIHMSKEQSFRLESKDNVPVNAIHIEEPYRDRMTQFETLCRSPALRGSMRWMEPGIPPNCSIKPLTSAADHN